ncbi:dienelactone hydrolase endo-1-3,1,4-beta-D-glucanase [Heliocybe sulcata]|uniref:Dienelactone hydrolase endo-1-3,1,4-beta-D-glucanase n=1 Tax=Heliocybe sulcata TaxID=5364 RepID=A0A5C3MPT0_9AGAM|nr:dienelactone hydrolase endo-1-3,1,4-beta-D-glucanase [Heliocybe sulcata]
MSSITESQQGTILPGEPEGEMTRVGETEAYLYRAPAGSTNPRAVFLLSDIFGLPLKNCKILADTISKRLRCDVWVPDLFAGSPTFRVHDLDGILPTKPGQVVSYIGYLKLAVLVLRCGLWMYWNCGAVVDPRVETFIREVKEDKKYAKVGAVGYGFGASICSRLSTKDVVLDTVVIVHPGRCTGLHTNADIDDPVQIPTSWACAEDNFAFKPHMHLEAEAILAGRKGTPEFNQYEFKEYKGTVHGFALRPHLADPEAKAAFEGALAQTVAWFEKTLV